MAVISTLSRIVYASAARTATPTPTPASLSMEGRRGMHVVIDVTAVAASPSVVPTIEGYDALSGKWYAILTGVAITATGTTVLKVYPGITPVANGAACDVVPGPFRITMTHGDADSITYSVSAILVP